MDNTLRTIKDNYNLTSSETFDAVSKLHPNVFKSGQLTPIGLGTQGIILLDPKKSDIVLKLGLDEKKSLALSREFDLHKEFYTRFEKIKAKGLIYPGLNVVEPLNLFEWKGERVMTMNRVRGQSLKTKEIIAKYFSEITGVNRIRMNLLSDFEVEYMATVGLGVEQSMVDLLADEALDSVRKFYPRFMADKLSESFEIMKQEGLVHTDFHSGNLMVDSNLQFHIIDLGSVSIKPGINAVQDKISNLLK